MLVITRGYSCLRQGSRKWLKRSVRGPFVCLRLTLKTSVLSPLRIQIQRMIQLGSFTPSRPRGDLRGDPWQLGDRRSWMLDLVAFPLEKNVNFLTIPQIQVRGNHRFNHITSQLSSRIVISHCWGITWFFLSYCTCWNTTALSDGDWPKAFLVGDFNPSEKY